ncbi:hypothetical protein GUJ93_ZPchr0001g30258 [Zizania palustris]|uniref:Uncharacterized protein n=1 Tax=Zizania palustris TaxID=103762 RepID=A0A8J5VAD7_ZIZPA|nr:hypothetical protein GUJ93_ZPchr0001g30258 [Zizania palustris]
MHLPYCLGLSSEGRQDTTSGQSRQGKGVTRFSDCQVLEHDRDHTQIAELEGEWGEARVVIEHMHSLLIEDDLADMEFREKNSRGSRPSFTSSSMRC